MRGEILDISVVIEWLNTELQTNLKAGYYSNIQEWMNWWKGYNKPFHSFMELSGKKKLERKLYTLKMGKKICEDWASILLNEKTTLTIEDAAASEFVQGKDDEQGLGGVLGANNFWKRGNELIEKAFASGTGAVVLRLKDLVVEGETVSGNDKTHIGMEFLSAGQIIPITVRDGDIVDVAFVSEHLEDGETYVYLETHVLKDAGYCITNRYFKMYQGKLAERPLPTGIAPVIQTGSPVPLFSIISPNIVNNIDESSALGMSILANAIDCLMGVDLAFNNFCRDFKLGGKKVFYNQMLTNRDEDGNILTPDDVAQQLFLTVGDDALGDGKELLHEFNPTLRVGENREGVQAQLDYLSFKCGFGTKHYQFNGGTIVTATQYTGDKQELIQNAAKHYIAVEAFIKRFIHAILWAGKTFCKKTVDPDAKVTVNFEDSYIIDKESERERDRQDVRDGLMLKWEYRVKWYGEDEETAKAVVAEERSNDSWMGFGGG